MLHTAIHNNDDVEVQFFTQEAPVKSNSLESVFSAGQSIASQSFWLRLRLIFTAWQASGTEHRGAVFGEQKGGSLIGIFLGGGRGC